MMGSAIGGVAIGQYFLPAPAAFTPTAATDAQIAAALAAPGLRLEYAFEQRTRTYGLIADVTDAVIVDTGAITLDNMGQGVMRSLSGLQVRADELPASFDPASSYLAVFVDLLIPEVGLTYWERFPLGLFRLDKPREGLTSAANIITLGGADNAINLLSTGSTPFQVAAGVDYASAVSAIVIARGMLSTILPVGITTPAAFAWDPTAAWGSIANALLAGVNYYPVWFDAFGRGVITPRVDPIAVPPAVDYLAETTPRMIIDTVVPRSQDGAKQINRAVVRVNDPLRAPFSAYAQNDDSGSSASVPVRGEIQSRTIDAPQMLNVATAEDYAAVELLIAAAQVRTLSLTTRPDPRRTGHETYTVQLPGYEEETQWLVLGWQLPLSRTGNMVHSLGKITSTAITVGAL